MLTILTLSTQTAAIDLSSGPCENRWPVPPVRRRCSWFVACNYNGYNSRARARPVNWYCPVCRPHMRAPDNLWCSVRFFFFVFYFIYLYSFRASSAGRRSRRRYIHSALTTASAFFEFPNDNGLKLARFDYRYRMPAEWTSRANSILAPYAYA